LPAARLLAASAALVLAGAALAACGSPGDTKAPDSAGLSVVTSTTVFADLIAQVAGSEASVHSLVPAGADVHTFDPRPSDVARIADADLVVMNGLGLDDWVGRIVDDAGSEAPVVELAVDLPGVSYIEGDAHADGDAGEAGPNPHLWLDVSLAARYVDRIAAALIDAGADPAVIRERTTAYRDRLTSLDAEVRRQLEALPAESRRIVSFHDAFPYFARAYGLEVVGVVVDSPGQDPGAGAIAALIDAVRSADVRAILAEAQVPPDLLDSIASETGVTVVDDLYTDAIGDPPADSFEGIIRWDVDQILAGLTTP
jgi:ABC-type Zn uptake system ZnuABC Zn-binding protein ZnuA